MSFTFGPDVVSRFLQKHDMDLICRAHQVVEDGYEFFSKRQLVTLFSAPNYCGEFDNAGAMMSVDETLLCSFQVRPLLFGRVAVETASFHWSFRHCDLVALTHTRRRSSNRPRKSPSCSTAAPGRPDGAVGSSADSPLVLVVNPAPYPRRTLAYAFALSSIYLSWFIAGNLFPMSCQLSMLIRVRVRYETVET